MLYLRGHDTRLFTLSAPADDVNREDTGTEDVGEEVNRRAPEATPSSIRQGQSAPASQKKIERIDEQEIVRIMTGLASTNMGGPEQFFKDLIERTALPASMQSRALAGPRGGSTIPDAYARELVQWAIARGRFTPEGGTARLTVLGEIIKELAEECGDDERARLGGIAERYQLLDDLTLRRLGMTN